MKTYGLTGGIGMGKSAAAQWLQSHGVAVVDTDDLARAVVEPGRPALREIQDGFGAGVLDADGRLRRDELASIVFADAGARKKLEAILHPRIRELWLAQLQVWRNENTPIAVVVIPLLYETGSEKEFDSILCVACSAGTQRDRLLSRGWSEAEIRRRNEAQMPAIEKMARANRVFWTEGEMEVLHLQLARFVAEVAR